MTLRKNQRTVLLTLGRLPVALELSRALHKCGWRVIIADPYAWHLGRLSNTVSRSIKVTAPVTDASRYLRDLYAIIDQEQVELVIPVSEETLYVSALKARLPEHVALFCIDQITLLELHDKYAFALMAKKLDVPAPDTVRADNLEQRDIVMCHPFVLKPRFSCSGAGIRFGSTGEPLSANELTGHSIVQKRLYGKSCSSFSITRNGVVLHSVCYQSLLESGSVAVRFERFSIPAIIESSIEKIVDFTHHTGMISFDFMQDADGVWCAIECNPRATSGIHFVNHTIIDACVTQTNTQFEEYSHERYQEFWSCLMTVEGALLKGAWLKQGWSGLFSTPDITFSRNDVKPFLLMCFIMAPTLFRSIISGKSLSEILMRDISWQGE